jgi:hypothetical protein
LYKHGVEFSPHRSRFAPRNAHKKQETRFKCQRWKSKDQNAKKNQKPANADAHRQESKAQKA